MARRSDSTNEPPKTSQNHPHKHPSTHPNPPPISPPKPPPKPPTITTPKTTPKNTPKTTPKTTPTDRKKRTRGCLSGRIKKVSGFAATDFVRRWAGNKGKWLNARTRRSTLGGGEVNPEWRGGRIVQMNPQKHPKTTPTNTPAHTQMPADFDFFELSKIFY